MLPPAALLLRGAHPQAVGQHGGRDHLVLGHLSQQLLIGGLHQQRRHRRGARTHCTADGAPAPRPPAHPARAPPATARTLSNRTRLFTFSLSLPLDHFCAQRGPGAAGAAPSAPPGHVQRPPPTSRPPWRRAGRAGLRSPVCTTALHGSRLQTRAAAASRRCCLAPRRGPRPPRRRPAARRRRRQLAHLLLALAAVGGGKRLCLLRLLLLGGLRAREEADCMWAPRPAPPRLRAGLGPWRRVGGGPPRPGVPPAGAARAPCSSAGCPPPQALPGRTMVAAPSRKRPGQAGDGLQSPADCVPRRPPPHEERPPRLPPSLHNSSLEPSGADARPPAPPRASSRPPHACMSRRPPLQRAARP